MKISGGIFDKNKIELKLKDLEEINQKENFWKDKQLVKKTIKQKKVSRYSTRYKDALKDFYDVKDLFSLASQEKNQEIIDECILKN